NGCKQFFIQCDCAKADEVRPMHYSSDIFEPGPMDIEVGQPQGYGHVTQECCAFCTCFKQMTRRQRASDLKRYCGGPIAGSNIHQRTSYRQFTANPDRFDYEAPH